MVSISGCCRAWSQNIASNSNALIAFWLLVKADLRRYLTDSRYYRIRPASPLVEVRHLRPAVPLSANLGERRMTAIRTRTPTSGLSRNHPNRPLQDSAWKYRRRDGMACGFKGFAGIAPPLVPEPPGNHRYNVRPISYADDLLHWSILSSVPPDGPQCRRPPAPAPADAGSP